MDDDQLARLVSAFQLQEQKVAALVEDLRHMNDNLAAEIRRAMQLKQLENPTNDDCNA